MSILDLEELEELAKAEAEAAKPKSVKGYVVASNEKNLYHVKMLKGKRFDSETGAEISKSYVQKFTIAEFKAFEPFATKLGYKCEVLFDPTKTV